jgi:hypothetical protein
MNPIKIKLKFEDHPAPLDPREISNYLYLVSGCILAIQALDITSKVSKLRSSGNSLETETRLIFETISPLKWREYFSSENRTPLDLKTITCNSPLDLLAYAVGGSLSVISLAVILSGGKIKVTGPGDTGFEAELPPLGLGIKKLRKAMGLDRKDRQLGFGVQSVTIKLSREEFATLMLPQIGEGGFQHFMRKLQSKTNKSTHVITLSVEDLDRIQSYKAKPKKGGFQSRYDKIFSRHLETE